jgi:aryl-alcohol dehydrogenase-like predicted oxidoreductase
MQYTLLGNTGLTVSRLAFGAMTFTAGDRTVAEALKK